MVPVKTVQLSKLQHLTVRIVKTQNVVPEKRLMLMELVSYVPITKQFLMIRRIANHQLAQNDKG